MHSPGSRGGRLGHRPLTGYLSRAHPRPLALVVVAGCGHSAPTFSDEPTLRSIVPTSTSTTTTVEVTTTVDTGSTTSSTMPAPTTTTEPLPHPLEISLDPNATEPEVKLGSIAIPKLGLDVTVYDGVLLTTLNKGPGHWPGTALPGQLGNVVIAGHRVTHSRPFRHLDDLAVGDPVIFTLNDGSSFTYEVVGSEVVTPDATWIVNQNACVYGHPVRVPSARFRGGTIRGAPQAGRYMRSPRAGLAAAGAGLLVGLSLPPWGVWPLAFAGLVALDSLLADQPARVRFTRGFLFGLGWLGPGMAWMVFLTVPGYPVAVGTYSAYIGAACVAAGPGRWRWLGLPAAIMIAETVRFAFPFGGVPLASLAISQAAGPFLIVARLGGAILLGGVTVAVAMAIRAVWTREWRASGVIVAVLAVVIAYAALAPARSAAGTMRVALVQGGGPQGTHAGDTAPGVVLQRHLDAVTSGSRGSRPRRVARERCQHRRAGDVRHELGAQRDRRRRRPCRRAGGRRCHRGRARPSGSFRQLPDHGQPRRLARRALRQGATGAIRRVPAPALDHQTLPRR